MYLSLHFVEVLEEGRREGGSRGERVENNTPERERGGVVEPRGREGEEGSRGRGKRIERGK
jgi:hypothetical protein